MIDIPLVSFAFSAGLAAFFAPCAFVLLPGYVAHQLASESKHSRVVRGLWFGGLASLGFSALFFVIGLLILLFGQAIKSILPFVVVATALALITIGALQLFGKEFFFSLPNIRIKPDKNGSIQSVLFGFAYGVASLGCVFPLFLTVMVLAFASKTVLGATLPLFAYTFAMTILMVGVSVLAATSQTLLLSKLKKSMPYIKKAGALILILAGLYMLYWEFTTLR
ncbi:hypothetical protein COT72_03155 [archaeon CG10_big_fil_rev_8_21_14_0_10_43_11]|nr:MAG: hypothetical protein COT72_03155 [archaeon CG10_big_fil_rev_8_21_14_0_10_43_11]